MYGSLSPKDRRTVEKAQAKITEVNDTLRCLMLDLMDEAEDYAEEHNLPFDDFVEDSSAPGGVRGVMYPENVSPDLDNAITSLEQAWCDLRDMLPKADAA